MEALGDDLAFDEDTSYLDEVPAPSDTVPGEKDTGGSRTQVCYVNNTGAQVIHENWLGHFCMCTHTI